MVGVSGVLLRQHDDAVERQARQHGLAVTVGRETRAAYDKTLIVGTGVQVPWQFVKDGLSFLDRWDAAAPLWQERKLASDVGSKEDRARTEALIRDLRVPLYAHELLFVRKSEAGERLLAAWKVEQDDGGDARLAFLRALYQVKPLLLSLPRSWIGPTLPPLQYREKPTPMMNLVQVMIAPGRYVSCRPGEEDIYRRRFADAQRRRKVSDAR